MRTSGLRCRDCVFVNRCVFMYTMTQTQSVPAKSLVYETPTSPLTSPPHTQWSHSARGAAGASARHQRDPLPVLSPFNDWISSRLPSSRVIAWWSARCCAKAGGGGDGRLAVALVLAWTRASRNSCSGSFRSRRSDSHSPGFSHWEGSEWKRALLSEKRQHNGQIVSVCWTREGLCYPKSITSRSHTSKSLAVFLLVSFCLICYYIPPVFFSSESLESPGFYLGWANFWK